MGLSIFEDMGKAKAKSKKEKEDRSKKVYR